MNDEKYIVTHYGAVIDDHTYNDELHGIYTRQKVYKYNEVYYIHIMYNGETLLFKEIKY